MDLSCADFVLTVSEGKRLIAKGVAALDFVQGALREGMVAVAKGTTNAYVLEELLGRRIEKARYCLGATLPSKGPQRGQVFRDGGEALPDVVFRQGEPVEGLTVIESVQQMKPGDVVIKGANALSHDRGLAGVLVGHPMGGTIGGIIGAVKGRKLRLVIPVGLEKQIAGDMEYAAQFLQELGPQAKGTPSLWPVSGDIVTEIEALETLSGAEVLQIGAGGVCGAEGAIWLMAVGTEEQVERARQIVAEVQGEPSFWEDVQRG